MPRLTLAYRPPYDWARALAFLAARAIDGIESVQDEQWHRTIRWPIGGDEVGGRIVLQPQPQDALAVLELSAPLAPAADAIAQRVRKVFDFDCEAAEISGVFAGRAPFATGLRVIGAFDGFELAVRAVLGQQVSVKAARTLARRFVAEFGEPLADEPAVDGTAARPARLFPSPAALAEGDPAATVARIAALGVIGARARTIVALARACADGSLVLEPGAPVEPALATLHGIPGIGDWTAQYIAMRALCWRDAFPAGDLILRRALGVATPAQARAAAAGWQPWRAYAVIGVWTGTATGTGAGDPP